MEFPVTLIDLAGFIALFLRGAHMVQTGIQRTFGSKLRAISLARRSRPGQWLFSLEWA
jgi:phosphate:Na+ symporter